MNIMYNIRNIALGVCEILDGFIRLITLGCVHTTIAFTWLVWWETNVEIPKREKELQNERE